MTLKGDTTWPRLVGATAPLLHVLCKAVAEWAAVQGRGLKGSIAPIQAHSACFACFKATCHRINTLDAVVFSLHFPKKASLRAAVGSGRSVTVALRARLIIINALVQNPSESAPKAKGTRRLEPVQVQAVA